MDIFFFGGGGGLRLVIKDGAAKIERKAQKVGFLFQVVKKVHSFSPVLCIP